MPVMRDADDDDDADGTTVCTDKENEWPCIVDPWDGEVMVIATLLLEPVLLLLSISSNVFSI